MLDYLLYIDLYTYQFIESTHIENNRYDQAAEMDLWGDNLKENLEEAAKEKRLNDFLVSLSASLSMKYAVLFTS